MQEVFPLEIDARAAQRARQTLRKVEGGGPSAVALQVVGQLFLEQAILPVALVFLLELIECRDERLRDITAAVLTESAFLGNATHRSPVQPPVARVTSSQKPVASGHQIFTTPNCYRLLDSGYWIMVFKVPLSHAPDEIFDLHMVLAALSLHAAAHVDAVRDDAAQRILDVHGSQASGEDGPVRPRSLDGQRPVERVAGSSKRRRVEGIQQESVDLVDTHARQRGRVFHPDGLNDGNAKAGTKLGRFSAVELHGPQATRGDELFDPAALLVDKNPHLRHERGQRCRNLPGLRRGDPPPAWGEDQTDGIGAGLRRDQGTGGIADSTDFDAGHRSPILFLTSSMVVCATGRARRAPPARMSRISSGLCTSCA